jgi:hypothetical protein
MPMPAVIEVVLLQMEPENIQSFSRNLPALVVEKVLLYTVPEKVPLLIRIPYPLETSKVLL